MINSKIILLKTNLSKISGKHLLILYDMSKTRIKSKINCKVRQSFWYRTANILPTQIHQLLICCPFCLTLQNCFLQNLKKRKPHNAKTNFEPRDRKQQGSGEYYKIRGIIIGILCQKFTVIKSWSMRGTQNFNYIIQSEETTWET